MERAPIHWAVCHNHTNVLSLLIKAKCDIEIPDKVIMTSFGC